MILVGALDGRGALGYFRPTSFRGNFGAAFRGNLGVGVRVWSPLMKDAKAEVRARFFPAGKLSQESKDEIDALFVNPDGHKSFRATLEPFELGEEDVADAMADQWGRLDGAE